MHAILIQFGALFGLLVLLNQLWSSASLPHALAVAGVAGVAAYAVATFGFEATSRLSSKADEAPKAGAPPAASGEAASEDPAPGDAS